MLRQVKKFNTMLIKLEKFVNPLISCPNFAEMLKYDGNSSKHYQKACNISEKNKSGMESVGGGDTEGNFPEIS